MLKQLADRYWSWKRRRAEQTIEDAYRRTAPQGQPVSGDIGVNNYYAKLREKPAMLSPTPAQLAAWDVQKQTIARKDDPPRPPDYVDDSGMGHFAEPTVRVTGMLPPIRGKDE